jgi:hypothetical protein
MSAKQSYPWLLIGLVATISIWSSACTSTTQPSPPAESPVQSAKATTPEPHAEAQPGVSPISVPSLPTTAEQAVTKVSAKLPPPSANDIKNAVGRVFDKAASADLTPSPEGYLVGDFNGDGSEDLAVVVTPTEAGLKDINSEVANWTLDDPGNVSSSGAHPAANKKVQADKGKTLLAIIHGVGPSGWHSAEAKQTYLLKNGVGGNMIVQPLTRLRAFKDKQRLPSMRGDAIQETVAGKSGLLFWNGSAYAWYSEQSRLESEID